MLQRGNNWIFINQQVKPPNIWFGPLKLMKISNLVRSLNVHDHFVLPCCKLVHVPAQCWVAQLGWSPGTWAGWRPGWRSMNVNSLVYGSSIMYTQKKTSNKIYQVSTMVDLPNTVVDFPNTLVDLPNTMIDLPNTMVGLPNTMFLLKIIFSPKTKVFPKTIISPKKNHVFTKNHILTKKTCFQQKLWFSPKAMLHQIPCFHQKSCFHKRPYFQQKQWFH